MAARKHLILFLAGMGERKRDSYLDALVKGITETFADDPVRIVPVRNSVGVRELTVEEPGQPVRSIEIRAVFWGDLIPSLSDFSLPLRAAHGLFLLTYWLDRKLFRLPQEMRELRQLRRWLVGGALLLAFWYVACLVLVFQAYGSSVLNWLETFGAAGKALRIVFSAAALLVGWKVFSQAIDVAYAMKAYLQDARAVRERVRRRVLSVWHAAVQSHGAEAVTFVAHSFGTVVAVEALSCLGKEPPEFDLVTFGSPLQLVVYRDPEFAKRIDACLNHPGLKTWKDFYAPMDAFCTRIPAGPSPKFARAEIELGMSFVEGASGMAHDRYFTDYRVLSAILGLAETDSAATSPASRPANDLAAE